FKQVYFTGLIRDKQGRKMSKQLGNSPDLLKLIEDHGADAVRFSVMISSPAGNDILYDEAFLEQARNFMNKIWNALKLIKIWEGNKTDAPAEANQFASRWIKERIKEVSNEVEQHFKEFNLREALKTLDSLSWDEYCSWYLEWIQPAYGQASASTVLEEAITIFEELLHLLHPFMPFVTAEIYQLLRQQSEDLMPKQLPVYTHADKQTLEQGQLLKALITGIRDGRNKHQLKPKDTVELLIESSTPEVYAEIGNILQRQVNATAL